MVEIKEIDVFPDNEPILVVTNNFNMKKQIDDGLYRETVRIGSLKELASVISKHTDKSIAKLSIIFTTEMDNTIREGSAKIESLFEVLNKGNYNSNVKVYEVGINVDKENSMFMEANRFGTLDDFILYAQTAKREQDILSLDPTDKQTQLIKSLSIDLNAVKKELEKTIEDLAKAMKDREEALGKLQTNVSLIEKEYKPKIKSLEEYKDSLEEKTTSLERELEIAKKRIETYLKEKDEVFKEKEEIYHKNLGLEETLKDRDDKIATLKVEIGTLKENEDKLREETDKIILSKVDSEVVDELQKDLDYRREKEIEMTKKIELLQRENSRLEIDVALKNDEISEIRRGTDVLATIGRTMIIDKGELTKTDLVYIKVVDDLPYHRSIIWQLFKMLEENRNSSFSKNVKLLVMRYDNGTDKYVFSECNIVGSARDINSEDRATIIVPNPVMFEGIYKLEDTTELVVLLDYMGNNEYYLNTLKNKAVYNIVKRTSDLERYGLKGRVISLDSDSTCEMNYNKGIGNAVKKDTKEMYFRTLIKQVIWGQLESDGIVV